MRFLQRLLSIGCLLAAGGTLSAAGPGAGDIEKNKPSWLEQITATNSTANGYQFKLQYRWLHLLHQEPVLSDLRLQVTRDGKTVIDRPLIRSGYECRAVYGPLTDTCNIAPRSDRENAVCFLTLTGYGVQHAVTFCPTRSGRLLRYKKTYRPECGAFEGKTGPRQPVIERRDSSGATTATLRYGSDWAAARNFKLIISRVRDEYAFSIPGDDSEFHPRIDGILVRDLNGDGEPEVFVCINEKRAQARVYEFDAGTGSYDESQFDLGPGMGARPVFIAHPSSGLPVVMIADYGWARTFEPPGEPDDGPLRFFQYERGRLEDVSAAFPDRLRQHAENLLAWYQLPNRGQPFHLAGYVAEMSRLGKKSQALVEARKIFHGYNEDEFFRELEAKLAASGY